MALQLTHFNKWTSASTFLASQYREDISIVLYSSPYLGNERERVGCYGTGPSGSSTQRSYVGHTDQSDCTTHCSGIPILTV